MKKSSIFLIALAAIITAGICFYGEVKDKKEVAQYEATYKKQAKEENVLQERDDDKEKESTTSKDKEETKKKEEPKKTKPVKKDKEQEKDKKEEKEPTAGYTIKEGDDLQVIANKCGISTDELMKMNQWSSLPIVQPGQVIQVPANKVGVLGGENISQQAPTSSAPAAPAPQNNGAQGAAPTPAPAQQPAPVQQPAAPAPVAQ